MSPIDLRQLDLNLLVVLDVLLEERHVTRAARRLGRTQSSVSHALARLREQLGDPVLIRVGGRMEPSPRARSLAPEIKRVLQTVSRILSQDDVWDPGTSDRGFSLVAPDFVALVFSHLVGRLSKEAPLAQVELVSPTLGMLRDVAVGRFDLAIAPSELTTEDGLASEPLIELPWAVFARREHPSAKCWGREAWLQYPHIRIRTLGAEQGPVDHALSELGLVRRRGPSLPHFLMAPPLLASTDLLLTVPQGALTGLAEGFRLATLPCPIELPSIELALYYSVLSAGEPAMEWFRTHVRAATQTVLGRKPRTRSSTNRQL